MTSETTEAGGPPRRGRNRVSIEERSARRERAEHAGRDRYDSLLRQLRAGREVPVTRRRARGIEWHPIAGRLILAVVLGVAVYLAATLVSARLRETRVDTWAGPTSAVQSGQRLDTCAEVPARNDSVFPTWIRYGDGVFIEADADLPIGETNIGKYYIDSGYTNGSLRIYDVAISGMGEPGTRLLVRSGDAPAGELYRLVEGCS